MFRSVEKFNNSFSKHPFTVAALTLTVISGIFIYRNYIKIKQNSVNTVTQEYHTFVVSMKKAAVLSIAAFYLLLTTGMFVCIIHCTGEYFFQPKIAMHSALVKHKQCCNKGCGCCNKHDNYVMKENIPPAPDFHALQIVVITQHQFFVNPLQNYPVIARLALHESYAPPNLSGKSIAIKFRSIQI